MTVYFHAGTEEEFNPGHKLEVTIGTECTNRPCIKLNQVGEGSLLILATQEQLVRMHSVLGAFLYPAQGESPETTQPEAAKEPVTE